MLTKENIAMQIAEKHNLSKAESRRIVNEVFDGIIEETKKDDGRAFISGFGSFTKADRVARNYKNPRTGEVVKVDAKVVPHFKAGKEFKEAVK